MAKDKVILVDEQNSCNLDELKDKLRNNVYIEHVTIQDQSNNINPADFRDLLGILQSKNRLGVIQYVNLKSLRLANNNLANKEIFLSIANIIYNNNNLQALELSGNNLGNENLQLILSKAYTPGRFDFFSYTLRELRISKVGLTEDAGEIILKLVNANPNLIILDISNNMLTDKNIAQIHDGIKNLNLQEIILANNQFTDASLNTLISLINKLKDLKEINLSGYQGVTLEKWENFKNKISREIVIVPPTITLSNSSLTNPITSTLAFSKTRIDSITNTIQPTTTTSSTKPVTTLAASPTPIESKNFPPPITPPIKTTNSFPSVTTPVISTASSTPITTPPTTVSSFFNPLYYLSISPAMPLLMAITILAASILYIIFARKKDEENMSEFVISSKSRLENNRLWKKQYKKKWAQNRGVISEKESDYWRLKGTEKAYALIQRDHLQDIRWEKRPKEPVLCATYIAPLKDDKGSVFIKVLESNDDQQEEIKILTKIQSPWIVSFYGYFETKINNSSRESLCLVMELAFFSLDKILQSTLPASFILQALLEISEGLCVLHHKMEGTKEIIAHRDLKPRNILMGNDYHFRLADFGLSKIIYQDKPSTSTPSSAANRTVDSVTGTPSYAAPEAKGIEDKADHLSDLYSFGLIVFAWCRRESMQDVERNYLLPNEGQELIANFNQRLKENINFPDILNTFTNLIRNCCVSDRNTRWNANLVRETLHNCSKNHPLQNNEFAQVMGLAPTLISEHDRPYHKIS